MMGMEEGGVTGGATLPPCEKIQMVKSAQCDSSSRILSWQPCVCLSAKSHYMHLPCSTAATRSHAVLLVRLYGAFSLDPLSSLQPQFSNL